MPVHSKELSCGLTEKFILSVAGQLSESTIRPRYDPMNICYRHPERERFSGSENDSRSTRRTGRHSATL